MSLSESRQMILFGGPGTGKSHHIDHDLLPELEIEPSSNRSWKTVFHPDYGYGDFMGKLLPTSRDGKVDYHFFPGHFLEALAGAYREILKGGTNQPANCALVIDEINRGNATSIFGPIFQLLDRGPDGWSSYHITLSKLEYEQLLDLLGVEILTTTSSSLPKRHSYKHDGKLVDNIEQHLAPLRIFNQQVSIPPNLYLLATMNTSDTSVFYMDSAFKRRWEWQFVTPKGVLLRDSEVAFDSSVSQDWRAFLDKLNGFITSNSHSIRSIEDKQVGYYFINKAPIRFSDIQNKLMFFVWDSVFQRDKSPLEVLLGRQRDEPLRLPSFGDFAGQVRLFVDRIQQFST